MSATATQSGPFRNSGAFRSQSVLTSRPHPRRSSGSFNTSANFRSEEKRAMREEVLKRRNALGPMQRAEKSAQICEQLKTYALNWAEERGRDDLMIGLYACMRSEVDVSAFARWAFQQGWYAAYPVMLMGPEAASHPMRFLEVPAGVYRSGGTPFMRQPLRQFRLQSPELAPYPECYPRQLDMVVVPMVAFDDQHNRLGYGGGNYDNFLPLTRSDCLVVGVAFEEQHVAQVPKNPHDIPLPFIVTA